MDVLCHSVSLSRSAHHSFLPDDRHPVLHSVDSVGDLGEVVLAQSFLAHRKGAVVGPCQREIIAGTFSWEKQMSLTKQVLEITSEDAK